MEQKRLKLITESNHPYLVSKDTFDIIKEQDEKTGAEILKLHGPFLAMDTKNKNERRYPENVIKPAVDQYSEEYIKSRGAYGEMGHPDDCEVKFERACHLTTDITWEGKIGVGTAEILEWIPKGKILQGLIERKCRVGMSTRGLGDIDTNSSENDVIDYMLLAIDAVADPSTPGAFVDGILESKEFILDESNGSIKTFEKQYDILENAIKTLSPNKRNEILKNAVNEFLNNI